MNSTIALTVDAVIFAEENHQVKVLLIKRKNKPFKDQWALPGGFLEENETLQAGCQRELEEETGLLVTHLIRTGIYDAVNRDPRGRAISVAFASKLNYQKKVKGNDDAAEAKWIAVKALPEIAFDHQQIIADALQQLKITV